MGLIKGSIGLALRNDYNFSVLFRWTMEQRYKLLPYFKTLDRHCVKINTLSVESRYL